MVTLKVRLFGTKRERLEGLLHAKKAFPVLLKTRFGIHTFGLRFPIDVLILDNNSRVVRICCSLKPNRIFLWPPVFDTVVELPTGAAKKKRIKPGDTIKLIP